MKIRNLAFSIAIALGCFSAAAQQAEGTTENVFQPHWYVQAQIGGQETLGETSFGKLLSPNIQLGGGYNFTPLFGARFSINAWQSKAAIDVAPNLYRWKWSYIAPMADVTFDLSNFIGGYNPNRKIDVNIFAGLGVNFGFNNDRAAKVNNQLILAGVPQGLQNLWTGTKALFTVRFGAAADYRINQNWAVGLELQANTLSDKYNSKRAGNADWYFNAYAGVKYTFGKTHTTRLIPAPEPVVVYQDRIVEKIVEVPVVKEVVKEEPAPQPVSMRRDVFFTISSTKISSPEMMKVAEIAQFLKEHPNAKVTVTGYADKGTGSKAINLRLCNQRAATVARTLTSKYGIAASRITTLTMTYDTPDQPYNTPKQNRVAICVAE